MIRLFDLSLQINGFPIKEAQAELQKIINLSEEEYSAFLEIKAWHLRSLERTNRGKLKQFVSLLK